jgi:hypothetical protein
VLAELITVHARSRSGALPPRRQNHWVGQTDTAVTGAFGVSQKTLDMAGCNKVYHYEFDKSRCLMDFQVDAKQVVTGVKTSGSDPGACPRKLACGATY